MVLVLSIVLIDQPLEICVQGVRSFVELELILVAFGLIGGIWTQLDILQPIQCRTTGHGLVTIHVHVDGRDLSLEQLLVVGI